MRTAASLLFVSAPLFFVSVPVSIAGEDHGLAKQAEKILRANCYRCHGQNGSIEGSFNYVLNRDRMVARRKVVPRETKKSRILQRIVSGNMPPAEVKQRPSSTDIAVLTEWIKRGAPSFRRTVAERRFISPKKMIGWMEKDLNGVRKFNRLFTRYITITHLYNAGLSDDELQTYRFGVSKLINSLSWGRRIVAPKAVDPARTVLRIDLRDYKWSEQTWDKILSRYPYGIAFDPAIHKRLKTMTETDLPHVRGDWFVAVAARPPLYHDILDLPKTEQALEKELKVDVAANIRGGQVARAGFNGSGVSRNNRLIERHESVYGAYWKSYDFAGNSGVRNLFAHPLGPGAGAGSLVHDGGEIIFNLPNGLQAYMLVDEGGRRINKGPLQIVSDPNRRDRTVVNGLSCMSCHARGIIDKEDQIRGHVMKNGRAFTKRETEDVFRLYPPQDKLKKLFKQDANVFQQAVEECGGTLGTTEPVVALAARFETELDLQLAAAESGLQVKEFLKRLQRSPKMTRALGGLTLEGGTVQRQAFADAFPSLIEELKLGRRIGGMAPTKFIIQPPDLKAAKVTYKLPSTISDLCVGGGGRFLILHLPKLRQLAVFDVSKASIVHTIRLSTDSIRFAAGREKLIVLDPTNNLVQRYDLFRLQRDVIKTIKVNGTVKQIALGSMSDGPVYMGIARVIDSRPRHDLEFLDLRELKTCGIEVVHKIKRRRFAISPCSPVRASANGRVFSAWGEYVFQAAIIKGKKCHVFAQASGAGGSSVPGPAGQYFYSSQGGVYDSELKKLEGSEKDGRKSSWPAHGINPFHVSMRTAENKFLGIFLAGNSRPIAELPRINKDLISHQTDWWGRTKLTVEKRTHFIPDAKLIITIPDSKDQLILHRFDVDDALEKSGRDYLFVTSHPPLFATRGESVSYQVTAKSKSRISRFQLVSGPSKMTLSDSGRISWRIPDDFTENAATVTILLTATSGRELFHSFKIRVDG